MYYEHVKGLPNFTKEDGVFIQDCFQSNVHRSFEPMVISEMYLSKTIDLSANNLIGANEQLAKSNRLHTCVMIGLTAALVFASFTQIWIQYLNK